MSVDNLSGSLLRLDNYEGQPFSTTCGDHYFYPAPFQTGQVCSTERIPEASGVDGVSLLGLPLGLLHMRPLQFWLKSRVLWRTWTSGHLRILVNHSCISALKLWCNLDMYRRGMTLGLVTRCTIVMTDVSTSGWGTVSVGSPTSGCGPPLVGRSTLLSIRVMYIPGLLNCREDLLRESGGFTPVW